MSDFVWGGLPYIAFTFLIVGTIVRYVMSERNWTTKSSEFLDKKHAKWGEPIFHFALLCVIGGHVMGILIPQIVTESLGMSETQYHDMALMAGAPAGILLVLAFFYLMWRRFLSGSAAYLKANTSTMDKWLYFFLGITILTGITGTLSNADGAFNYRLFIGPWFRGLLYFDPQPDLMLHIPLIFKIHMLSWMTVAILFPFTRLVHCLSIPFRYLWRAPIVYRKR